MKKIYTHRVDNYNMEKISDSVCNILNENINNNVCSVFMNSFIRNKNLDKIILYFVYTDINSNDYVNKNRILNINGIKIYVSSFNLIDFFNYREDACVKLKIGKILYDPSGDLKKIQNNFKEDNSIITYKYKNAVNLKPTIQYVKK